MDLVCERCRGRRDARAARCERCDPCWEALLDGRWLGPITRDELLRTLAAHAAGGDALVWRAGTEAWSSACEIPELAEALGLRRPVAPARAASPSPLLDSVASRVAREREIEERAQGSGRIDLGALVPAISARPMPPPLPPRAPAPLPMPPPLPALAPAPFPARPARRPRARAEVLAVGALLGGGLVAAIAIAPVIVSRLGALDATTAEPGSVQHTVLDDGDRMAPRPSVPDATREIAPRAPSEPQEAHVTAPAPSPAPRASRPAVTTLAAAPPAARETPAPRPEVGAGEPSPAPVAPSGEAAPAELVEVAAPTPSEDVPAEAPRGEPSIDSLLAAALTPDSAPDQAPAERAASTPAPDADALPSIPSRDDVERAIARAHAVVATCGAQGHGLANVRITAVGATGRVTSALVEGPLAGTPAGSCVARAVRQMELPRFTRDTFTVLVPFRI